MNPLDYRRILELYDILGPKMGAQSVSDFSQRMNKEYNTELFREGVDSNPIRESSIRFTDWLGNSPVGDVLSEITGEVGSYFGVDRTAAEQVGRQLPRSVIDFAPAIGGAAVGTLVGGPVGTLIGGLGLLGSGASAGVNTYGETGSAAAGTIAGGVQLAMPGVGKLGTKVAGNVLARTAAPSIDVLGTQVGKVSQRPMTEMLTELAGEAGLQTLAGEVGGIAAQTTALVDRQNQNPLDALGITLKDYATKENLFQTLVGELPFFVGMDLPQKAFGYGRMEDGTVIRSEAQARRNASREQAIGSLDNLFREQGQIKERSELDAYIDNAIGLGQDIDKNTFKFPTTKNDVVPETSNVVEVPEAPVVNSSAAELSPVEETVTPPVEAVPVESVTPTLDPVEVDSAKIVEAFKTPVEDLVEKPREFFADPPEDLFTNNETLRQRFEYFYGTSGEYDTGMTQLEATTRAIKSLITSLPESKRLEHEALMARPEEMTQFDDLVKKSADIVASRRGSSFDTMENYVTLDNIVEEHKDVFDGEMRERYGVDYDDATPLQQVAVAEPIRDKVVDSQIRDVLGQLMGLSRVVADEELFDTAIESNRGLKLGRESKQYQTARERIKKLLPFVYGNTESMSKDDLRLRQLQKSYHAKYGEKPSIETLRNDANAAIKYFQDFYQQVGLEKLYEQLPSKVEQDAQGIVEAALERAKVQDAPEVDQQTRVRQEYDTALTESQGYRAKLENDGIPARRPKPEQEDERNYGFQLLKQMVNSLAVRYDTDTESIWGSMSFHGPTSSEVKEVNKFANAIGVEEPAGAFTPYDQFAKFYISLGKAGSADIVAHEMSHMYLTMMEGFINAGKGGDVAKADMTALREFAGLKDGEMFREMFTPGSDPKYVDANEKVTEAWMKYLKDGVAPTPKIQAVFDKIKQWFRDVYFYFTGEVPDELRPVFDRWLTTEDTAPQKVKSDNKAVKEKTAAKSNSAKEFLMKLGMSEEDLATFKDADIREMAEGSGWKAARAFARRRSPESAKQGLENDLRALSDTQLSVGRAYYDAALAQGHSPREAAQFAVKATQIAGKIPASSIKYGALDAVAKRDFMGIFKDSPVMGRIAGQFIEGVNPSMDYATMAHEVAHGLFRDIEAGRVPDDMKIPYENLQRLATQMEPDDRYTVLREVYDALLPEGNNKTNMLNILANVDDPEEFTASLLGAFAMSGSVPNRRGGVKEALKFLPHEIEDFGKGYYRNLFEYTDAIGSQFANPQTQKRFTELTSAVQSLLRTDPEAKRLDEQIAQLAQSDPHQFGELVASGQGLNLMEKLSLQLGLGGRYLKTADPKGKLGVGAEPNWYERNAMAFWQLAQKYPSLQVIEDLTRSHRELVHVFRTRIFSPLAIGSSKGIKYVEPDLKSFAKLRRNVPANRTFNRIRQKQNDLERPLTDAELDAELRGLPAEYRNKVGGLTRNWDKMMESNANVWRNISQDRIATSIIAALQGLHTERAKTTGSKVPAVSDLDKIARQFVAAQFDPRLAPTVTAIMASDPEQANAMVNVWSKLKPKYDQLDRTLKQNAGYSPESARGFVITYENKAGKVVRYVGKNAKEHQANLAKARTDTERVGEYNVETPSAQRDKGLNGIPSHILEAYADVERTAFNEALALIPDDALRDAFAAEYSPGDAVSRWTTARTMSRHLMRRSGNRVDASEFDYMTAGLEYSNSLANFAAKDYVSSRKPLYLNDARLREDPNLVNLASQHIDNVLNPLSQNVGALNNLNFLYWMGFNPSSAIMDLSQSGFVMMPNLVRKGLTVSSSVRTLGKAMKLALTSWTGKSTGDAELDSMIKHGYESGAIDRNATSIFGDEMEHLQHSIFNLADPTDGVSLGNMMKNAWYYVNKVGRFAYQNSGEFNSKVGFISGYLAHKKLNPKSSVDELFDAAKRFNEQSNFHGGSAARPVFKDVDKIIGRNARGMVYNLSHYTTSMYGLYLLRAQEALGRLPISSVEKGQARRALATMAGAQALAGGAIGLPLVGSALALVNSLTGLNVEEEIKDFARANADDPNVGQLYAQLVLDGAGAFAGPLDVSGRVGLGTVMGIDNYGGIEVTDVMGPTVNLAKTMGDNYNRWKQGDMSTTALGVSLLPNGVRRVIQSVTDGGAVRGSQGRLIYQPDLGERIALGAGFQPRKLSEQRSQATLQRNAAFARNSELKKWRSQVADLFDPNNPESALLIQREVMERKKAELTLDVDNELRNISQVIANRQLPDDPRRLGPKTSNRVPVGLPRVSETERYLHEKAIERTLNARSQGPSQSQFQKFQAMDYLIQSYNLTSPQANAALTLLQEGYPEDMAVASVRGTK